MDANERFRQWAARARHERAPTPDVTAKVMRSLARTDAPEPDRAWAPPWPLQATLAGAAVVVAMLGLHAWNAVADPWGGWLEFLSEWWLI